VAVLSLVVSVGLSVQSTSWKKSTQK